MQKLSELIHYLPETSKTFFAAALVFLLISLFFLFRFPASRYNYLLLFIATALAGFGFAYIDDFLHPWDEQFHALVAKNMTEHPFRPTLLGGQRAEVHYRIWTQNDIWLHKQPLFLWQIALSLKLFGANLIALRLPSILLHAATACFVLAIGKRYLSFFFSVLAAVLFAFSGFINDFTSGAAGMDHNDVAFCFYVTGSFWAWLHYQETRSLKWAVITGLFSGGAILCKWLVGLIVYAGWGIVVTVYETRNKQAWKHLVIAFGTTLLLALPWQLYCMTAFPKEFGYEMAYNRLHFSQALEGHGGDWLFYFQGMKQLYGAGEILRFFVLAGMIFTLVRGIRRKKQPEVFAVVVFAAVYLFFTAAATKLDGYVVIVSSFGFLFLLVPFQRLFELLSRRKKRALHWAIAPLFIFLGLFLHFNPKGMIDRHFYKAPDTKNAWIRGLNSGAEQINALAPGYRYILIKNPSEPNVPSLRFMTGKEIYPYVPELEGENVVVIDLAESADSY